MKHVIIAIMLCFVCAGMQGQNKKESGITVEGVVFDETDYPIPGANVYLKDRAGIGTVTDVDGKFSLKGAELNDVLVVSFLGYEKENIRIEEKTAVKSLKVKLKPMENALDETVVVGLGSQRKVSLVGAVTTVDVKDLQVPATSIPNMLGGRVPGVISLQTSGEPGKNISDFWIRGIGTFGANQGALVLIDGLEGDLSQIDPAERGERMVSYWSRRSAVRQTN